uniref:RING-type domain-containing protein n=1 Tax=Oryza brachyantha TaxID=4533 RepID=J3N615_ORYBR
MVTIRIAACYLQYHRLNLREAIKPIKWQEFLLPGGDGERFGPPGPRLPPVHRNPFPSRQERAASESSARAAPPPPTFPGAAAATAADISCLGKRKYEGPRAGEYSTECVICIEEFEVGDDLSTMPCPHGHRFHEKCLAKWLARRRSCPLCRHLLPANSTNIHSV